MDNTSITVQLLKPGKGRTIRYTGEILRAEVDWVLILAHWERPRTDLGYVVFEPGDAFYEYYYTQRWYNIFEIRTPAGALKGWYCNITRPAVIEANTITSEDLELDLFVSPERTMMLRLDREEFEARGFATHERNHLYRCPGRVRSACGTGPGGDCTVRCAHRQRAIIITL